VDPDGSSEAADAGDVAELDELVDGLSLDTEQSGEVGDTDDCAGAARGRWHWRVALAQARLDLVAYQLPQEQEQPGRGVTIGSGALLHEVPFQGGPGARDSRGDVGRLAAKRGVRAKL
jgi:hypothetical protein